MGMFDDVYCEADLPPGHPESEREFQTKSLCNCMDRFTITKEGRLVLHTFRYESSGERGGGLLSMGMTAIPTGDVDTEFHGDIELVTSVGDRLVEYVARFTHGTLEWIRPLAELSEIQKKLMP
jgi:hypothetical protein